MADELKSKLRAQVELVQGSGGVFEVEADDQLVFSKRQTGRFPEPGEVLNLIRQQA